MKKQDNESLIQELTKRLDWYIMKASDEEFDADEVQTLMKLLDNLKTEEDNVEDELPVEEALDDFWKHCEEREEEERLLLGTEEEKDKSEPVAEKEEDKPREGKLHKVLWYFRRRRFAVVAAAVLVVMVLGGSWQVVANAEKHGGFFWWMDKNEEGTTMITAPEGAEESDSSRIEIYDNIKKIPEDCRKYVEQTCEISAASQYNFSYAKIVRGTHNDTIYVFLKNNSEILRFEIKMYPQKILRVRETYPGFTFEKEFDNDGIVFDVFSKKEMSRTLVLLLLADLLKESGLPSRQVSLFALVDALLENKQNVELLSRGNLFENKYQALWPDTDAIRKETDEVYNRICEDGKFKEVMDVLLEFAEKLRLIVWSMTAEGNKPAETVEKETDSTASELTEQPEIRQKIIRAYVYEREFRRIKALPDFKKLLAWLNENQINLRQFKHKISIVFQNARDGELNLLFTGDAQPEHLKMIAENYDGKLPLYEHYWCIKVPHHGTQGHYFDFSQYEPENMLISNGIHFANSKKESKELRTSPLYGGLFYIPDTHMYCSNCDCCDSYENGCSCKEADVISPAYYKDI